MSDIGTAVKAATERLKTQSDSARADAEILMAHVLGCARASVSGHAQELLTPEQFTDFERLVERRIEGRPVAYLTGVKEFWSLSLAVTPDVLIPRPETELLVEWALELVTDPAHARIADLGTGSGAIAIVLGRDWSQAHVVAMDASEPALRVATANARRHGARNVEFMQADFKSFLAFGDAYDLIVSNPPYIAEGDPHLQALTHEPRHALVSGADGLDALRQIVRGAPVRLKPGGWLLVEHGAEQGEAVRGLMQAVQLSAIETRRDLAGHERATAGCRA